MHDRSPNRSLHYPALDSLRGLAALAVLLSHIGAFYRSANGPGGAWTISSLERLGHPAVVLFFVLSGFVLTLAYADKAMTSYANFVLRRAFRIYPAFLVCFVASLMAFLAINPEASANLGEYWNNAVPRTQDISSLAAMSTLLMRGDGYTILPVTWSLVHEIRFSIIFPLMLVVIQRFPKLSIAGSGFALAVATAIILYRGIGHLLLGNSELQSWVITGFYLPVFALGMSLAINVKYFQSVPIDKVRHAPIAVIAALSFLLDNELVSVAASCTLIILSITPTPVRRALEARPLTYLGQISFSLYLVHFPILFYTARYTEPQFYLSSLLGAGALSLLMASALNAFVEVPFQRVGKRLLQRRSASNTAAALN